MFSTTSVESLFLFVDSDGVSGTGYSVGTMGAEFMVELDGWNDSVQSSDVCEYAPSSETDAYDWNSWESLGGAASRLDGSRLEAMGEVREALSADARFMLLSQDQMARLSVSASVPLEGGALKVTQSLSPSVPLSGILPVSESTSILTLEFECDGASGTVESVALTLENLPALTSVIEPFTLEPGEVETLNISVDTSDVDLAQFVSASVSEEGIESSFTEVVVTGHPARAYVGAAPSSVEIDGAFGDWYLRTLSDVDLLEVENDNIDISEVGVFNTTLSSSFFISVDGEMCSGSYVPYMRSKPVPGDGGGAAVPVTRKTAEDITRVYIDGDMSTSTGLLVSVESKVIGADYLIEVRGLNGEVVSSTLSAYSGTSWALASQDLDVEVDSQRMEVGVLAYNIGGAVDIEFIIETTDWRQRKDYVALDTAAMLALTGGLGAAVGTESWAVYEDTTSSKATAASNQRKIFYDGTNFWSFFYDGTNTMYKYSTDGGATWSTAARAFSTIPGVTNVSLWYDEAGSSVYIVGDSGAKDLTVCVGKGSVSPSAHSISWVSYNLSISTYEASYKNASICQDPDGRIWVASTSNVNTNQVRYQLRAYQSNNAGDITAWTDKGNILNQQAAASNPKITIVPGDGTSALIFAVYSVEGKVACKYHDGSGWSSEDSVYAAGASAANTEFAPGAALLDANGVLHVVYGTGAVDGSTPEADIEYRYYQISTDTWSTARTMDVTTTSSNSYPCISLDESTGNVYVMWIENATKEVKIEKNVSGSWSSVSISQTTGTKVYLTSIYSAPSESYICFQWTETSGPLYDVVFERIPEFSEVVVPVLFMLTVFIAIYRRRARPEEPA